MNDIDGESISERIQFAIESDDYHSYDVKIEKLYETLDDKNKMIVDSIFIEICGYSLNSIIKGHEL